MVQKLSKVCNIHLSSFAKDKNHLPLYLGDFQTKPFMQALERISIKAYSLLRFTIRILFNPFL